MKRSLIVASILISFGLFLATAAQASAQTETFNMVTFTAASARTKAGTAHSLNGARAINHRADPPAPEIEFHAAAPVGSGGNGPATQADAEWVKFSPPEGHFSILLPGPAQPLGQSEAETNSQGVRKHIYFALGKEIKESIFMIGYGEGPPPAEIQQALDRDVEGMVKEANGTLLRKESIGLEGYQGREIEFSSDSIITRARLYGGGRRLYILFFVRPKDSDPALASKNAEKFFSSFKPAPVPSAGAEAGPGSAADYNNRGKARYDRGDLDGALSDYNKALELDPRFVAAYNNRGLARRDKGDLEGAIADYNKATEISPLLAAAYYNRGSVRRMKGDLDGAIADATRAIELEPGEAQAYSNRGLARVEKGDLAGATADFDKAIEINPRLPQAYSNRCAAKYWKGDLDGAVADCNRAIELDPRLAEPYSIRGGARATKGDLDGAMADYNKAIELNPRLAPAYSNRCVARGEKGDFAGAVADCTKAIELDPRLAMAYANRGLIKLQQGKDVEAQPDLDTALKLDVSLKNQLESVVNEIKQGRKPKE